MPVTGQPDNRQKEAIRKGIAFIGQVAKNPINRREYGTDLLWCLYSFSATPADAEIRRMATPMAREAAKTWLKMHAAVPADAGPDELVDLATGAYAAAHLGFPAEKLVEQVRQRAAAISVRDYFGFDPRKEAPPAGPNRFDLWCDALITAQAGEIIGVTLGAPFADVIRWLPAMRPYPELKEKHQFYPVVYSITHAIYTINNYSAYAVDRECLRPEFDYLRENLDEAVRRNDPETMGEFLDSLRAFGMTDRDSEIQRGVAFLLSTQNADGSWGDPKDKDVYDRYHSTWTAVDGLLEYRFLPAKACPVRQ
jgi:hypothetical protein